MRSSLSAAVALSLLFGSTAVLAAAGSFTLVNGTDRNMADVAIRRFGAQEWRPLGISPAAGGRSAVRFSDPDCAFDIRANLGGGITAIWSGVNLCEVSVVRVRRDSSGNLWVDYD